MGLCTDGKFIGLFEFTSCHFLPLDVCFPGNFLFHVLSRFFVVVFVVFILVRAQVSIAYVITFLMILMYGKLSSLFPLIGVDIFVLVLLSQNQLSLRHFH